MKASFTHDESEGGSRHKATDYDVEQSGCSIDDRLLAELNTYLCCFVIYSTHR